MIEALSSQTMSSKTTMVITFPRTKEKSHRAMPEGGFCGLSVEVEHITSSYFYCCNLVTWPPFLLKDAGKCLLAICLGRREECRFWKIIKPPQPQMDDSLTQHNLSHVHENIIVATSLWKQCRKKTEAVKNIHKVLYPCCLKPISKFLKCKGSVGGISIACLSIC